MAAQKPTQPPAADMSVLVNTVDALSQKVLGKPLGLGAKQLPRWKRWLGGDKPDYDGTGLRDVVNTNALYLDNVKKDLDEYQAADNLRQQNTNARLAALEAQINNPPFPG